MRMQPSKRIVADRSHRNDLLSRLKSQRIIDFHGGHFSVQRQIPSPPIMYFRQSVCLLRLALTSRTLLASVNLNFLVLCRLDQPQHDRTGGAFRSCAGAAGQMEMRGAIARTCKLRMAAKSDGLALPVPAIRIAAISGRKIGKR